MKNISIVITARNYGQYLTECINSCKNQTVKPYEIIYSDDCSDDGSVKIAKSLGVKVIENKKWIGVVKARNKGVDATKGNILLHVDGDDMLSPDYIEKCLEVFDESTPFVFCAAQAFGTHNIFWRVNVYNTVNFLWNRNYVNTSALMWKEAFIKAGGWQETCQKTMWDWSLALRMSRLGMPKKSSAVLLYRQHENSVSIKKEKYENNFLRFSISIRRELVKMTIGLVYSCRIEGFLKKWMNSLVKDINILQTKPELIIINNSDENLKSLHNKYDKYFEIKIITGEKKIVFNSEVERRNKVCELLSECYNRILENATGEIIHLREDDIIPNEGSFEKLYDFITDNAIVNPAVAGVYLNRNVNFPKIVGGRFNNIIRNTVDFDSVPSIDKLKIDYTGTGFLMFWKDLCPKFSPYLQGIQAHDWAWGLALKNSNKELWMLPDAVCKHYIDFDNYVLPNITKENIIPAYTHTKITNQEKKDENIVIRKPKWNK